MLLSVSFIEDYLFALLSRLIYLYILLTNLSSFDAKPIQINFGIWDRIIIHFSPFWDLFPYLSH